MKLLFLCIYLGMQINKKDKNPPSALLNNNVIITIIPYLLLYIYTFLHLLKISFFELFLNNFFLQYLYQ